MTAGIVLALLYCGRSVLIPLAVAIMLSLLLAPLVRALRRIRVGRTCSVLIAVAALTVAGAAVAVALGTQMLHMVESLPQYESNVQRKLKTLDEFTIGRVRRFTREANRFIDIGAQADAISHPERDAERSRSASAAGAIGLKSTEVQTEPMRLVKKLLATVWGPVQFVGIVLLVLVFVLLEYESLRDRFIRVAAATHIRSATVALNDAGDRLSRYFVSQFLVNFAFGLAIWMSLSLLHFRQALLCGFLAAVMRFVPYVGVGIMALFAAVLAFAVDPGWSVPVWTVCVFILLDIVIAQFLEPQLYGYATGLSPLSVVVAAIFWSSLWGPAGLILSTPLTLCLLVAGRHMKGLGVFELLLGNTQPLTLAQRFYQRALSADPHEIVADAREFLKSHSLAAYCDRVVIPATHLARLDEAAGATTAEQQLRIRGVVVDVATALSGDRPRLLRRRDRGAVLEEVTAGRWLRRQREQLTGVWQGPLGVPKGSVVICISLGLPADDLATELLVRLLRSEGIDARNFSAAEMDTGLPSGADPDGVALVFIVSAFPGPERVRADSIARQVREILPHANVVRVLCPGVAPIPECPEASNADLKAGSLGEAVQICMACQKARTSRDVKPARAASADKRRDPGRWFRSILNLKRPPKRLGP